WGDGYANMNDIWWRQLARELRLRGYAEVEVLGVGKRGASTHDELDQLRKVFPKYRPDLVIMGYVTNDPDEHRVPRFDYSLLDRDPIVQFHQKLAQAGFLPRLNFQLAELRKQKLLKILPRAELGWEYQDWEMKLVEPENLRFYRPTVQALGEFVRQSGVPFFMMSTPDSPTRKTWVKHYTPVEPIFAENHVRFYNILDDFARAYAGLKRPPNSLNWGINPANGHPGVLSTHFYAVAAADILERDYPAALGPRTPPPPFFSPEINDWMPANLAISARTPARVTFTYPASDDWMIRLPVGRPHVMFSLAMPARVRAVRVTGPALRGAEIYLTNIDAHFRFDSGALNALPRQEGRELSWPLDPMTTGKDLNTIRLVADFTGADRTVTIELLE
ncbi:MAG TPA: SGNH/GDSL hydrolase family protein, partial [Opitutaceae bacterium]|nr:SGNH/GDSL hydrolase family protein [Opitutaceae bacterium]